MSLAPRERAGDTRRQVRLDTLSTEDMSASHLDWHNLGILIWSAEVVFQTYRTSFLLSRELPGGPHDGHSMRAWRLTGTVGSTSGSATFRFREDDHLPVEPVPTA
jgi:hypothetical protein